MTEEPALGPRIRRRFGANEPMFATAASLMTNTVLTNGLGLVFWIAAARLYDAESVGRDSALVGVMIELSTIGQLDLANAAVRFLPAVAWSRRRLIAIGYAVAIAFSTVVATVIVLVVPRLSDSLRFLSDDRGLAVLFVAATALWSIFAIQDGVLTALGKAAWIPVENALYGVLKLVALVLLAIVGLSHGPFMAFVIPMALLLIPVNVLLFRRVVRQAPPATEEAIRGAAFTRRRLVSFLAQDYAGSVLVQAGLTILPLLVVALLGSRSNAYFYLPLLIVLAFDTLFVNAATSLVVTGAAQTERRRELTLMMARRAGLLLVPGALLMVAAAPLVLLVFGQEYADEATTMMRLLALASIARAATGLFTALARFDGDGRAILLRQLLSVGTLVLGTVLLAPPLGLTGVGLAWLLSSVLVAVTVVPSLRRALR